MPNITFYADYTTLTIIQKWKQEEAEAKLSVLTKKGNITKKNTGLISRRLNQLIKEFDSQDQDKLKIKKELDEHLREIEKLKSIYEKITIEEDIAKKKREKDELEYSEREKFKSAYLEWNTSMSDELRQKLAGKSKIEYFKKNIYEKMIEVSQ